MTRPTMIREVNVKAHPNKLPTLLFELAQMLMEHSGVKPGIHAHQAIRCLEAGLQAPAVYAAARIHQ
jgi:hypothetical protein